MWNITGRPLRRSNTTSTSLSCGRGGVSARRAGRLQRAIIRSRGGVHIAARAARERGARVRLARACAARVRAAPFASEAHLCERRQVVKRRVRQERANAFHAQLLHMRSPRERGIWTSAAQLAAAEGRPGAVPRAAQADNVPGGESGRERARSVLTGPAPASSSVRARRRCPWATPSGEHNSCERRAGAVSGATGRSRHVRSLPSARAGRDASRTRARQMQLPTVNA